MVNYRANNHLHVDTADSEHITFPNPPLKMGTVSSFPEAGGVEVGREPRRGQSCEAGSLSLAPPPALTVSSFQQLIPFIPFWQQPLV